MRKYWFLLILLFGSISCSKETATADFKVIPRPERIESAPGEGFVIRPSTRIVYPKENPTLRKTAELLADYLVQASGMKLRIAPDGPAKNAIVLKVNFTNSNPEAYQLSVDNRSVAINGSTEAGVFYGVQTLYKALPVDGKNLRIELPAGTITDMPRFRYRGMHLDVARHFFSKECVKRYIDILALHNINRFHWHLTDDQGWRIEIKKYPELAEKGQWRKETLVGSLYTDHKTFDGTPYGGYYTQDDIREIVDYARDRFITIIPEIDLPGHMLAALSVYPELGCTGGPYETATQWGVFPDILCMGNEQTYRFLEDIFTEITDLFPSEFIHIGGDEAPKERWKACPKCQAKIRELGIRATPEHSAENQLQSYAVHRIERFLNSKGREVIGWDEILEGGVNSEATIMSWRGVEGGIQAAELGHDVIMVPNQTLYFDYYQSKDKEHEPLAIGGYLPVRMVYDYEPIPDTLTPEQAFHIIGLQANLWTEYIKDTKQLEYMLLPRLAALAEVQWTPQGTKDYDDFLRRMEAMFRLYDHCGYNYARHICPQVDSIARAARP